jgi:hypothetical protein
MQKGSKMSKQYDLMRPYSNGDIACDAVGEMLSPKDKALIIEMGLASFLYAAPVAWVQDKPVYAGDTLYDPTQDITFTVKEEWRYISNVAWSDCVWPTPVKYPPGFGGKDARIKWVNTNERRTDPRHIQIYVDGVLKHDVHAEAGEEATIVIGGRKELHDYLHSVEK